MDESTDSVDTAQLLILISGTDENFAITEELVGLCSMKGHATRKEIADEVKCVTEKFGLTFENLVAVCTDGSIYARQECWCSDSCGKICL
jgi:hypothetical protein